MNRSLPWVRPDASDERPRPVPRPSTRPSTRPSPLPEGAICRMVIFERCPSRRESTVLCDVRSRVAIFARLVRRTFCGRSLSRNDLSDFRAKIPALETYLDRSPPPRADGPLAICFRTSASLSRSGVDTLRRGGLERLAMVSRCEILGEISFGLACLFRPLGRTLIAVSPFEACPS